MPTYLLVIHMLIALCLVGLILLQRSEGGGLGIGGGATDMMGTRGMKTFLTRLTAWLAAIFMASSLGLTMISSRDDASSIIDRESLEAQEESDVALPPLPPLDDLIEVTPLNDGANKLAPPIE